MAEIIHDFERSSDQAPTVTTQKYAFIEPSKTHRVSNPALKAFQKNAVQSYFERQQQQQNQQQNRSKTYSKENTQPLSFQQQQLQLQARPHSFQAAASAKELSGQQLLRNSLPNNAPLHLQGLPKSFAESAEDNCSVHSYAAANAHNKAPSPAPPPPPPRSRSLMPTLLRRSSSASDYGDFREQYRAAQDKVPSTQLIKNI